MVYYRYDMPLTDFKDTYLIVCRGSTFLPFYDSSLTYSPLQLFDRISSQVVSPSRPPGDGINRCRDAVDAIQSATSHKYSRDRAELIHLLGSPHIQVSACINYHLRIALLLYFESFFYVINKKSFPSYCRPSFV